MEITPLDILEAQQSNEVDRDMRSAKIPIDQIAAIVIQRRRVLAIITGIGTLVAVVVAFLIPNIYTSYAQLMPPDPQTFSDTSALTALSSSGLVPPGLTSNLLNQRTPGATTIAVLESRNIEDKVIDQFDLRRVYRVKYYLDAEKKLAKRAEFTEDKASGVISIAVSDRDSNRAYGMAQAYIDELNQLANSLSTSSARREREFLEKELASVKAELDTSTRQLAEFSSRNATVDLQNQDVATVTAASRLQAELIAAESELSGLKTTYAEDNVRVREVRGRIAELQTQLNRMSGSSQGVNGANPSGDQPLPSLRALPLLGITYFDLYRKVSMDEAIYETLSKQYEIAKVDEAKEIPPIKVLDSPRTPEKKSAPQRLLIVALGTFLSALGGVTWFTVRRFWWARNELRTDTI
jgi:uncharacterized protein involved in exopolysaccharide biosynthesis